MNQKSAFWSLWPEILLFIVKRFSLLFLVIPIILNLLLICDLNAENGIFPARKSVNGRRQWARPNGSQFWVSKRRHRQNHRTSKFAHSTERFNNELPRVYQALPVSETSTYLKNQSFQNASFHQYGQSSNLDLLLASSSHINQISLYDPVFNFSRSTLYSNPKSTNFHVRSSHFPSQQQSKKRHHHSAHRRGHPETKKRPNIIFMLTDDQDIELGSMNYMPKALSILSRGGVHVKNAYVTTPMCCPSRSSILTGRYVHNHNVYTNGENCSSPQWQKTYESQSFGKYLHDSGYRTAFFGKYLNEYNGSYIPAGWSHFSGLIRNSRYYSYQLNVNGDRVRHGSDYHLDYYPDLILNDSLQYMRYSNRFFSSKPYLMVMSFPSPHGPEDAAPQFQKMFFNEKGHRTPSWNHAPNGDKQWLLRKTPKMARIHQDFTDFLNTKRLQTLQSVDNAVYQIYSELKNLGELENTYIIYTSDHGYHLGQFGLVKGKAMPFEFDIRVPFFVRGPGVPHDQTLPQIVLNIDIAPTLLDIAEVKIPSHMDGISFLPYLKQLNNTLSKQKSKLESRSKRQERVDKKLIYRDSFLIEKGKFKVPISVDKLLIPIIGKKQWLQLECQKPEYSSPCKMYQKFECFTDRNGAYRIRKCSRSHRGRKHQCICPNGTASLKNFGNEVNNQHDGSFQWQRRRETRLKRSDDSLWTSSFFSMFRDEPGMHSARENVNNFDVAGVYDLKKLVDLAKSTAPTSRNAQEDRNLNVNRVTVNSSLNDISNITTSQLISILQTEELTDMSNYTDYLNRTFCTVARTNLSIECTEEIYHNQESWKEKKNHIDAAIKELQRRLFELKGIRRFMNEKRPIKAPSSGRKSKKCHCDPTAGGVSQFSQRMQVHPRRLVERRFMKHLVRKKWSRRHEKKMRKKEKFENTACKADANEQMNCFTHGPDHWKTAPFWTQAPFCFCQNAQNNSFECLRTINETHNSLYCEFVTGFIAYFDLLKDPFQLKNAIYELEFSTIEELSRNLAHLKGCSGAEQCTLPRQQTPKRRSTETDSSVYSKTLNNTNAQLS